MNSVWYEIIGYIASGLIAISLTMRSVLKLRVINLVGAIFFTVYGLLIKAYPVAAVNGFIIVVNMYYLAEMFRAKPYFTVVDVRPDSTYLKAFLDFYHADIERFVPQFAFAPAEGQVIWLILRNVVPIGLFIADHDQPERLMVQLDYVIPGYRDLKPGTFLYTQQQRFQALGVQRVCNQLAHPDQQRYFERMGFAPANSDGSLQCRSVV